MLTLSEAQKARPLEWLIGFMTICSLFRHPGKMESHSYPTSQQTLSIQPINLLSFFTLVPMLVPCFQQYLISIVGCINQKKHTSMIRSFEEYALGKLQFLPLFTFSTPVACKSRRHFGFCFTPRVKQKLKYRHLLSQATTPVNTNTTEDFSKLILPLVHIEGIVCFFLFYQSFPGIFVCKPVLYPHVSCVSQQVQEPLKETWLWFVTCFNNTISYS